MSNLAKSPRKSRNHTRTIIFVLIPVFIFLVYSVVSVYGKSRSVVKKDTEARTALFELETRQKNLSEEIDKLHTDAGVEEALRDKYRAVKEGEGVVVIVDEKESSQETKLINVGFWDKVKSFFIKK